MLFRSTVAASRAAAPLVERAVMASAIIAWSGLSVHGQVASVLNNTDIRMGPYFFARLCHAAIAGAYTFLLFRFLSVQTAHPAIFVPGWSGPGPIDRFVLAGWQLLLFYGGALVLALLLYLTRRYRLVWVGRKAAPR